MGSETSSLSCCAELGGTVSPDGTPLGLDSLREPCFHLPVLLKDVQSPFHGKAGFSGLNGVKDLQTKEESDTQPLATTFAESVDPATETATEMHHVSSSSSMESVPVLDSDGLPMSRLYTDAEEKILRQAKRRWTSAQLQADKLRRASEFEELIEQTRLQMLAPAAMSICSMPANRYGADARMPTFEPERHTPMLALINPFSGAMAGSDILCLARQTPYYQNTFFNIIDVVKDQRRGGLLDVFRLELCRAKEEAKEMGTRPRLISGGGDGTASFTLFMVFAALRADPTREEDGFEDQGNGLIWTDKEMKDYFPALAQMPLGSANDFGRTLGWGQRYPGDSESRGIVGSRVKALDALRNWISSAIDPRTRLANFDVFGIVPRDGEEACNFKLAELSGRRGLNPKVNIDGKDQLLMKEAGLPVPLFLCLYFSAGFAAYMTARFQMNRRRTPLQNKLEYARQAFGIVSEWVPPQLNVGLDGVQITCGGEGKEETYFPPRAEKGNTGRNYREVGFLNINWQAGMANGADRAPMLGRICSTREPAKFNDGRMDMYRLKFASAIKNPGLKIQTDKKDGGITFTHEGTRGKGIFFQWDGEARFAFSPSGEQFHINIRKMLNIPVVLGPEYDARVTGDPDNGRPVHFAFAGPTEEKSAVFRERILRGVCGELNAELLASRDEMAAVGLPCEGPR